MLDEALEILAAAWSGEPVHHHGTHYTVDDIQFLPGRCSSRGYRCGPRHLPETANRCAGPPAATACSPPTSTTPISSPPPSPRLPRYVGPASGPYDIAVGLPIGVDPAPFAKAGATWWLQGFPPGVSLDVVRGVLRDGPAQP
jgi:hypothetical protein